MGSEWGKSVQHQSTTPGSQFWIPSKPSFTLLWDLSRREILMTSSHAPHWFKMHKPPLLWHGNSSVYLLSTGPNISLHLHLPISCYLPSRSLLHSLQIHKAIVVSQRHHNLASFSVWNDILLIIYVPDFYSHFKTSLNKTANIGKPLLK